MNLYFCHLEKEYDANKGVALRVWARERNFSVISVARGENPTMYAKATEDAMIEAKNKFSWIKNYRKDADLKIQLE